MSKMNELAIIIEDLLEQGQTPFMIAQMMNIPVSWVYEVEENNSAYATESLSPFETCNS